MKHAITQSLEKAYAHHIQRLMVTGNFALLAGIHPDEIDKWYLGIYIDAIEWVEITNTRGMSQFADGGIMATKPYISGSYNGRVLAVGAGNPVWKEGIISGSLQVSNFGFVTTALEIATRCCCPPDNC